MYEVRAYYKHLYFDDDFESSYVNVFCFSYDEVLKSKDGFEKNPMYEQIKIIETESDFNI